MANTRQPFPICKRDGFPMVRVDGKLQCVAEYIDKCVGGQQVVNVIQEDATVYYVFESGHELPLLCFCCGTPLVVENLEQSRRNMRGRRLEGMLIDEVTLESGDTMIQFGLDFSENALSHEGFADALSPLVAAQMRHPASCPRRKRRKG
jgi:hypothetical protein